MISRKLTAISIKIFKSLFIINLSLNCLIYVFRIDYGYVYVVLINNLILRDNSMSSNQWRSD